MYESLVSLHWVITVMAISQAAWMVFDGSWALLYGDYVISASEVPAAGNAPWARVVAAVGIPPRSVPMKILFVVYGLAWLVVATAFAADVEWAWRAMLALSLGSLWYLNVGSVTSSLLALSLIARQLLENAV